MKKRKEEILCNKEKSKEQSTEHHLVQSTEWSTVQSMAWSNEAYMYSVGTLAALAISVCLFFTYKTSQVANKKQDEKQDQPPKRPNML